MYGYLHIVELQKMNKRTNGLKQQQMIVQYPRVHLQRQRGHGNHFDLYAFFFGLSLFRLTGFHCIEKEENEKEDPICWSLAHRRW